MSRARRWAWTLVFLSRVSCFMSTKPFQVVEPSSPLLNGLSEPLPTNGVRQKSWHVTSESRS